MTYKLDQTVKLINSPVNVVFPDSTVRYYSSGEEVAGAVFDRLFRIVRITTEGNAIVLELEEAQVEAVEDPFI